MSFIPNMFLGASGSFSSHFQIKSYCGNFAKTLWIISLYSFVINDGLIIDPNDIKTTPFFDFSKNSPISSFGGNGFPGLQFIIPKSGKVYNVYQELTLQLWWKHFKRTYFILFVVLSYFIPS